MDAIEPAERAFVKVRGHGKSHSNFHQHAIAFEEAQLAGSFGMQNGSDP